MTPPSRACPRGSRNRIAAPTIIVKRVDLLAGAAIVYAASGAAAQPAISPPVPSPAADAQLAAFLDAEWAHALARSPETASYQGDRSGDDRWDDVSPAAQSADLAHARDALTRLERLDRSAMSEGARLNSDLFGRQLRDTIRGFELQTYLFAVNQRGGVQTDSAIVEVLAFTSRRDFEALIARIESWPRKVDQTIELLHEAVARKRLWPQVVMARVPEQIDRLTVAPEEHPFFAPFRSLPAAIGTADAARLRDAARNGIATRVLPAQQNFKRFMIRTYLPAAPGEVGLRSVPDGLALYDYFLRTNTTTSLSADRIHAWVCKKSPESAPTWKRRLRKPVMRACCATSSRPCATIRATFTQPLPSCSTRTARSPNASIPNS